MTVMKGKKKKCLQSHALLTFLWHGMIIIFCDCCLLNWTSLTFLQKCHCRAVKWECRSIKSNNRHLMMSLLSDFLCQQSRSSSSCERNVSRKYFRMTGKAFKIFCCHCNFLSYFCFMSSRQQITSINLSAPFQVLMMLLLNPKFCLHTSTLIEAHV